MFKIRQIILMLALLSSCLSFTCNAVSSLTLYVGHQGYLTTPKPPQSNAAIFQASWGAQHKALKIVEQSAYGCTVKVTEYFEGVAQVQCDYYWRWYDAYGYQHTNHATTYMNVYCKGVDIVLTTTNMTLQPGEGQYIQYYLSPSISPAPTIRFISNNTNIATVSSDGYVRGISSGSTTITIKSGAGPDATCNVYVQQVDPTSISITPTSLIAYVGETSSQSLSATLYPSGATSTVSWYSSDTDIATVSSSKVTGVGEGTTTIYARTANGLRSNDCTVTVKYRTPTGISVSPSTLYLPIGERKKLSYSVSPSNARTSVTWLLDDGEGVVSLEDNGTVTALKAGTAVVKVRTDNGYSGICKITVPPMPEKILIPEKISLMYGTSRVLEVTPQPADAYLNLSWKSSDNSVASVSSDGKVIARKPGIADITVFASNGVNSTCRVEVESLVFNFIVWTGGEEKTIYPLDEKPIVTFSDNNIIVKTSSKQIEYAKDNVLKFTMEDASVMRMPESIELIDKIELAYKQKTRLDYTLYPTDYDIETHLTWSSDKPDIVRVDQSGEITACSVGTATVTVTAENGCMASCTVLVPKPKYYFVVWLEEGGFVAYSFEEHPKVTYQDEMLNIVTDLKELNIKPEKVKKFTINDSVPDDSTSVLDEKSESQKNVRQGSDFI